MNGSSMRDGGSARPPPQDELERLFDEVGALAPPFREAYLQRVLPSDAEVGDEVLSLLEHAAPAEAFFGRLQKHALSTWSSDGEDVGDPTDAATRAARDLPPGAMVGRYRIVETIGAGGMGVVYRAHDEALDRDVALKLLPPSLSSDPTARERFLREARAAAALDHPHICTVHEAGEDDSGRLFLAMVYYEGETLKARLSRGPLPLEDVTAAAIQLARGLAAAHARGIVHRDVKPANVMVAADGAVKLLDFGLARVADDPVTRPGLTPGTVAYMSPEQVRGDRVDHRTDLWALGVLLYEMLAGVRPFRGGSDRIVLDAIVHTEPEALRLLRPETREPMAHVIERLLKKNPEERYGSAQELLADLEPAFPAESGVRRVSIRASRSQTVGERWRTRLPASALGLVVLVILVWVVGQGEAPLPSTGAFAGPERVLVADFANFTSDALLGDAVAQALRMDLARSPALHVASAATVAATLRLMRQEPDARLTSALAREVAVREGMRAVIDGEVRSSGTGYMVSAAMVEAATGAVVDGWRETAPDSDGLMDAVDRLSGAIRASLGEGLASLHAGDDLFRRTTVSLEALRTHSQAGRAYFRGDFLHAAALFEEAIRLDPAFAQAHLLLAHSLGAAGVSRGRGLRAFANAYRLRDQLSPPERHAVDGNYYRWVVGDLPKAKQAFVNQVETAKRAGDVVMYASLADALALSGDLAGAEAILREAREVYPTAVNQSRLVQVLYRRGKLRESAALLEEVGAAFPRHAFLTRVRAEMASASGDYAAADALANELPSGGGIGTGRRLQALTATVRGRMRSAIEHLAAVRRDLLVAGHAADAIEVSIAIGGVHIARGHHQAGVTEVETFLVRTALDSLHPLDRAYLSLARFFAEAGEPGRAREFLEAYEREVSEEFRGGNRWSYLRAQAGVSFAEGDFEGAVSALELAALAPPAPPANYPFDVGFISIHDRPELARAYERSGHPDSAIAVYERYLAATSPRRLQLDAFELPRALIRLAELYEARNDPARAASHYLRFAELWNEADPELRPRAEAARRRAGETTAQPQR
jgi:tetratricopeptide (TPR) repeat protein/TolB-like protein